MLKNAGFGSFKIFAGLLELVASSPFILFRQTGHVACFENKI